MAAIIIHEVQWVPKEEGAKIFLGLFSKES